MLLKFWVKVILGLSFYSQRFKQASGRIKIFLNIQACKIFITCRIPSKTLPEHKHSEREEKKGKKKNLEKGGYNF